MRSCKRSRSAIRTCPRHRTSSTRWLASGACLRRARWPGGIRRRLRPRASRGTARVGDDRFRQQLTPQELQVALTLAEGTTTREAAARLYLSPKTVEYHLRHVYDKLEIRSREELQAALMSHARPGSARKALMFTDLTSSTNLVEAIGDAAWHDLSAWLDGELRRCFKEHHGHEVDHAGTASSLSSTLLLRPSIARS